MARAPSVTDVLCQNPRCDYYDKTDGRNIVKRGKDFRSSRQRYCCKHCGKTFYFISKIPIIRPKCIKDDELIKILGMIKESYTTRRIAQDTKHHLDTIRKLVADLKNQDIILLAFLEKELFYSPEDCTRIKIFLEGRRHPIPNDGTVIKHSRVKITPSRYSWYKYQKKGIHRKTGRPRKKVTF